MGRFVSASLIAALLAAVPAAAHHSYAAYHTDRVIRIDGILESLEWVNPHSQLTIRTPDSSYTVEWRAANAMSRVGIDRHASKR